jgi:hypothetical protein
MNKEMEARAAKYREAVAVRTAEMALLIKILRAMSEHKDENWREMVDDRVEQISFRLNRRGILAMQEDYINSAQAIQDRAWMENVLTDP